MKKGTVVLTPFPFTDLSANKIRPAVVISSSARKGDDIIVAFISSVITELIETDLHLRKDHPDFKQTGLKTDSIIKLDKLATISKEIVLGSLGSLPDSLILLMNQKLKIALDLSS
ncbi:type II toxin-antitoxin system PemK/MazF family toxin [bacterium]|nr:type II toxin-antitoxin system PemK/MazF family toxin [bacterium]